MLTNGQDADGDLGSVAEGGADDAEAIVAVGEADAARAASPAKAGAADAIVAVGADVSPAKVTGGAGQLVACLSQVAQALVARKPRGRPKGTARPKAGAFFCGREAQKKRRAGRAQGGRAARILQVKARGQGESSGSASSGPGHAGA